MAALSVVWFEYLNYWHEKGKILDFIILLAHFLADIFLGEYLAHLLKSISIFCCDFSCYIDARPIHIFYVHCTVFPISWTTTDTIAQSIQNQKVNVLIGNEHKNKGKYTWNTQKYIYLFWLGKKCFCWSWMRLSCHRPMLKLITWFQIW